MARTMLVLIAAGAAASGALAANGGDAAIPAQSQEPLVCQTVVAAEPGAKPYKLCKTEADWKAHKLADSKNANRIVCRYEEVPGTRFRSKKVCQSASEWATQRMLQRQEVERIQMQTPIGR